MEVNKIFIVIKRGVAYRWKVIENPYFPGTLALVRDYCGMTNGFHREDINHICGCVTLDDAYERAFLHS